MTQQVWKLMRSAFAPSTFRARKVLYKRAGGEGATQWDYMRVIEKMNATIQTKHVYARHAVANLKIFGFATQGLVLYARGLLRNGAGVPSKQAPALTRDQVNEIIRNNPGELGTFILLMWKTASRFGDIFPLTKANFVKLHPNRVTIFWGRETKTSKINPYSTMMYTTVCGKGTRRIFNHVKAMKGNIFPNCSYYRVRQAISMNTGKGYTAHSIKAGAITHLFKQAKRNNFTLEQIQQIAKHKNLGTTLRYTRGHQAASLLSNGALTRTL